MYTNLLVDLCKKFLLEELVCLSNPKNDFNSTTSPNNMTQYNIMNEADHGKDIVSNKNVTPKTLQ